MDLLSLDEYEKTMTETLAAVNTVAELEHWHAQVLGRAGHLTRRKRGIGSLPASERPAAGRAVQQAARYLQEQYELRRAQLEEEELAARLRSEAKDVTFDARPRRIGGYHPVTRAMRSICRIFEQMGFVIFETPHVELDEFNFQLLNIPKDHPARDMQDTFYVSPDVVLRTHTSAGQIRAMRAYAPKPCQVILPGLCYRNEAVSPRSEIQFHQLEGILVGPLVRFSDLKGILLRFARFAYGPGQEVRLRGSYFPFTEPSVEVDVKCMLCGGEGCRVCKQTGWLEVLGAGLIHPAVLRNGGYDPDLVRGIAFGMGIERTILQQYDIDDIRHLYQNDSRLLRQFH